MLTRMIRSFRGPLTEDIFRRNRVKRYSLDVQRAASRKLAMLDAAESLDDLRVPPGNRLERLKGNRKGEYSIRVNDQWRICFTWSDGDAYNVEIADYH
jgi:proteic killer suppression protein